MKSLFSDPAFISLLSLMSQMFIYAVCGMVLRKKKVLTDQARSILTDLVMDLILPANIIHSFEIEFSFTILQKFILILIIAAISQMLSMFFANILWNKQPSNLKRVLQYATQVSNAGFLGNPVCEGVFGAEGLMYASVFLIPQRIVMWSAGLAYFTDSTDWKGTLKKVARHPCIVAVYIGMFLMVTQIQLPTVVETSLVKLGGCTLPLSMILIGMMMADVNLRTLVSPMVIAVTGIRLFLLPAIVYAGCLLFHVDPVLTGVSVLLVGMPCGSTTPILASKHGGDYIFASKCVFFSTLASLFSVPIWCMIMGV